MATTIQSNAPVKIQLYMETQSFKFLDHISPKTQSNYHILVQGIKKPKE